MSNKNLVKRIILTVVLVLTLKVKSLLGLIMKTRSDSAYYRRCYISDGYDKSNIG